MRPRSVRKAINGSTIQWSRSVGDRGTLVAVRRIGNRLSIAIRDNNEEHVAILDTWTPPPTLEEVEAALAHMIGMPILDVKRRVPRGAETAWGSESGDW